MSNSSAPANGVNAADTSATASDAKSVYIIFNPVSGTGDPETRKKHITDEFAKADFTCEIVPTSESDNGTALAKKAIAGGAKLLVIAGGDGTVMEAMAALVGTDIPIAVIPTGTGNLLSLNLGIPLTIPEAVEVALQGQVFDLDLGHTSDNVYFAIMGGIGLDADMIADADRQAKRRYGKLAYLMAAVKNVGKPKIHVSIRLDGKPAIQHRAATVLIANMGKITGGLEAVPTASPHDGLLDVGIVRHASVSQWLRLVAYALVGRTHHDPDFDVHQAKKISITLRHAHKLEFDGEDAGEASQLNVEVVPKAVKIMLPQKSSTVRDLAEAPEAVAQRDSLIKLLPAVALMVSAVGLTIWWRHRKKK